MELISEKESPKFIYYFATVWLGFFLYLLLVSGMFWIPLSFLTFGSYFFAYYIIKVKEVTYCGESIKVKKGNKLIEIPLSNIENVKLFSGVQGCYRINFKSKTVFGNHIVFPPRTEKLFRKHKALKKFLNQVNT